MKSIVLIQPKGGGFDLLGARIPIGLLTISARLKNEGYKIRIIDQRLDSNWENTLLESLKSNPICVGVTCMTGRQIGPALKASKLSKLNSKSPVVWGGVHASTLPHQTIQNKYIDMVVIGEGELTFYELIKSLENGLIYKNQGEIHQNSPREFIKDLDQSPDLPYELVDVNKYSSINLEEGGKSLDFVSSRGCPFKCSFCYNLEFNKQRWRAMSAKETIKRVTDLVRKYNLKTIYFQDDNFCVNIERLKEILRGIIKNKLNITWGTLGLRVDTAMRMDDETFKLMYDSGCRNVDIGAESGSDRILQLIDKGIKIEDLLSVNQRLAKYPFIVKYTFIIGFPGETEEENMQTVKIAKRLVKENSKAYTPFAVYAPYPGTKMHRTAIKYGFVPPKSLEEWAIFNPEEWFNNFNSWLKKSEISRLRSIAFTSMFSNKNIKYKINSPFIKLLFNIYYPLAKLRFYKDFHMFPIEFWLSKKLVFKV